MLIKRKETIINITDSIWSDNISHSITIEEFGFKNEMVFQYMVLTDSNQVALFIYHSWIGRCIYVGGIYV